MKNKVLLFAFIYGFRHAYEKIVRAFGAHKRFFKGELIWLFYSQISSPLKSFSARAASRQRAISEKLSKNIINFSGSLTSLFMQQRSFSTHKTGEALHKFYSRGKDTHSGIVKPVGEKTFDKKPT